MNPLYAFVMHSANAGEFTATRAYANESSMFGMSCARQAEYPVVPSTAADCWPVASASRCGCAADEHARPTDATSALAPTTAERRIIRSYAVDLGRDDETMVVMGILR